MTDKPTSSHTNFETSTTTFLVMSDPSELRRKEIDIPDLRVDRMEVRCPEFNKFLHTMVGYDWQWNGRERWGKAEWYAFVNRDELETWVAYKAGTPTGYFELEKRQAGDVEILTFGLLPQFVGKGIGGPLLSKTVECAWEMGANKVWLHTCTHDHPHALNNYLARGFQIEKTSRGPANQPIPSFWEFINSA